MTESVSFLTSLNWLGLVHPVLMILFVYPVVGATIRLGILARERRLDLNPIAPTVPVEHADQLQSVRQRIHDQQVNNDSVRWSKRHGRDPPGLEK